VFWVLQWIAPIRTRYSTEVVSQFWLRNGQLMTDSGSVAGWQESHQVTDLRRSLFVPQSAHGQCVLAANSGNRWFVQASYGMAVAVPSQYHFILDCAACQIHL